MIFVIGVIAVLWVLFDVIPDYTPLTVGHVVSLFTGLLSASVFIYFIFGDKIRELLVSIFKSANVAEIELRGPIQEKRTQSVMGGAAVIPSKQVVKRIKKCKKKGFSAIVLNIDSPGGYPVPSEDIRQAIADVDVPTYTYVNSLCASGGYMIACGTDHIHVRKDSLVGSIGVIANQQKVTGLAEKLGIHEERFVGGEHKDTHSRFKELDEDEREYWQTVIDNSYENFVSLVAESRALTPEGVKATKAEVFDGKTALDQGLVDAIGSREMFLHKVRADTGITQLKIRRYNGGKKVWGSVENLFARMAYTFGQGIGTAVSGGDRRETRIEYRV